ncbi:hypothetical protein CPM_0911 [Cuniculiplasma divulgatum]|uniref:Uncharacterized protein n=1 Tax=Cuniculiplasma divulgatum TaxID=1673428 RepID=A0A1R4A707_9ARCH|nr:hypothetical protein CPM_0911 [Cuniculiplasma divulgatum]
MADFQSCELLSQISFRGFLEIVYTAKLHYDKDSDLLIQFFGSSVMDNQIERGEVKPSDRITIDKIASKGSGRTYYLFVLLSRTTKDE